VSNDGNIYIIYAAPTAPAGQPLRTYVQTYKDNKWVISDSLNSTTNFSIALRANTIPYYSYREANNAKIKKLVDNKWVNVTAQGTAPFGSLAVGSCVIYSVYKSGFAYGKQLGEEFTTALFTHNHDQQSSYKINFSNTSRLSKLNFWDFGDGKIDSTVNPAHVYPKVGFYQVCLKTTNNCNTNNYCQGIKVNGISSVTPSVSAIKSILPITINGAGFVKNSKIQLYLGNLTINATGVILNSPSNLVGKIDLNDIAARVGEWSIRVISPDGKDTLALPNSFKIEDPITKALEVNVIGPDRVLINRNFDFEVTVTNNTNQTAYGVPVSIRVSKDMDVRITSKITNLDVDPNIIPKLPEGRFYKGKNPVTKDSFKFAQLIIPKILPYSTKSIKLKTFATVEKPFNITATSGGALMSVDALKKAGFLRSAVCDAQNEPCEVDVFRLIIDRLKSITLGNTADCYRFTEQLNCTIASIAIIEDDPFIDFHGMARSATSCAAAATPNKADDYFVEYTGVIEDLSDYMDVFDNCSQFQDIGANGFKKKADEAKKSDVAVVRSSDPNLKLGKKGINDFNYVGNNDLLPFTIYFENADSATAPASEVIVLDTLDKSKFDLTTLEFTEIAFGDSLFKVNTKAQRFTSDIDMRPKKNIILRVSGELDTLTGILTWRFVSFDPKTMDVTQDVLQGFLPPNKMKPEGEGHVRYLVRAKKDLPHLTSLKSVASIIFDGNEAILTPIWTNTIDLTPPSSKVLSANRVIKDTNAFITVKWQGIDAHAGIKNFRVFVSENKGAWQLWLQSTSADSAIYKGKKGQEYCFYTVATDNADNVEIKQSPSPNICDVVIPTNDIVNDKAWLGQNYPNPSDNSTTIDFYINETAKRVRLDILNIDGSIAKTLFDKPMQMGIHSINLNTSSMASGLLFYRLQVDGIIYIKKMSIVK
jgi:PKD repeat protein